MSTSTFADRLRAAMDQHGWTQHALAQKTGLTQTTISGWLAGTTPYHRNVVHLCAATGLSRDWLLYGEGRQMMRSATTPPPALHEQPEPEHWANQVYLLHKLASPEQRQLIGAAIEAWSKTVHQQAPARAVTFYDLPLRVAEAPPAPPPEKKRPRKPAKSR